jgi:hypothetical protein
VPVVNDNVGPALNYKIRILAVQKPVGRKLSFKITNYQEMLQKMRIFQERFI